MFYKQIKKDDKFIYYDINKRINYTNNEIHENLLKFLSYNQCFLINEKKKIYKNNLTIKLKKKHSITNIQNRCFLTSRSRSVSKSIGLSRHQIQKIIALKLLPGIQKSSF